MYVKQIHAGTPELELSPEEAEAVRLALAGETQAPIAADLAGGAGAEGRSGVRVTRRQD